MARKISADLLKLHEGELGVWKKRKVGDTEEAVFETLLNFDFDILAKVVFARGSGAIYKITIPGDGTKDCFVSTDDSQTSRTFVKAVNQALCTELRCLLCDTSFCSLLMIKARQAIRNHTLPKKVGVTIAGKQHKSNVWAVAADTFIDGTTGNIMTEDEHDYIWLEDICCGSSLLRLPRTAHMPVLHFPLAESFRPLKDLMTLMKSLVGCNFIPALGMLAGVVMGMGYAQIVNHYQFCPTVIATGGLSCGKTTSLISALSTIGCHKSALFSRSSLAFIFGQVSKCTLPIGWDDPSDSRDLCQLLVDVYHQSSRGTAKEEESAHTIPLVTINDDKLKKNLRSTSRATIVHYEPLDTVNHGEAKATKLQELRVLQSDASCLIGRMISLATQIYTPAGFVDLDKNIAVEISDALSHCLTRVSETYPIWLYTLYKLADVIEYPQEEIFDYFMSQQIATINMYQACNEVDVIYPELQPECQ